MFARRMYRTRKNQVLLSNCVLKRYFQDTTELDIKQPQDTHFEPLPKKKPQRESFLKALLTGKVDKEVFVYPEQISLRYDDYYKWIKPIESYMSNCTKTKKNLEKQEVLDQLKELEVFRTHIDEQYFGLTLSKSESLQLVETLSNLPWLGTYILKNHILPIELISKYGSDSQKREYFPKIMSGEMVPTICIHEDDRGTNVNSIKSFIVQNSENSYVLNGEKTYVVNGVNSNLFLVFARSSVHVTEENAPDLFSLLLVERDFGGVTCTNVYDTIGRHDTPICTINFNNTVVPFKNIIGTSGKAFNILMDCLKPGQQHITGQAISILRNFINILIPDVLKMKHYDRNLYEFDIVRKILGNITYSLYTMESMAYLTSGMIDQYENQDAEVEQIITETFCANRCLQCIQAGLQLVGAQSYLNNKLYIQAFHDAAALTTLDTNNLDANVYVAGRVLNYIGKIEHEDIYKTRNFLYFPLYNAVKSLFTANKVGLMAEEHVHPSLMHSIQQLEGSIDEFKESVVTLLEFSGAELMNQFSNLERLTEMLTEIYAIYANMLRASRSYSIGVRNADIEKDMSVKTSYVSRRKVILLSEEIKGGPMRNGDHFYMSLMETEFQHHEYPIGHPLTKTF